jgi:hypothetical protein
MGGNVPLRLESSSQSNPRLDLKSQCKDKISLVFAAFTVG